MSRHERWPPLEKYSIQAGGYWGQTRATLLLDCRNVPECDFAIFRGDGSDLPGGEPDEIPIVVEVADTALTYDRTEKLLCYAPNDSLEYWSNLHTQTLECYRDPSGDESRERRMLEHEDIATPHPRRGAPLGAFVNRASSVWKRERVPRKENLDLFEGGARIG